MQELVRTLDWATTESGPGTATLAISGVSALLNVIRCAQGDDAEDEDAGKGDGKGAGPDAAADGADGAGAAPGRGASASVMCRAALEAGAMRLVMRWLQQFAHIDVAITSSCRLCAKLLTSPRHVDFALRCLREAAEAEGALEGPEPERTAEAEAGAAAEGESEAEAAARAEAEARRSERKCMEWVVVRVLDALQANHSSVQVRAHAPPRPAGTGSLPPWHVLLPFFYLTRSLPP